MHLKMNKMKEGLLYIYIYIWETEEVQKSHWGEIIMERPGKPYAFHVEGVLGACCTNSYELVYKLLCFH